MTIERAIEILSQESWQRSCESTSDVAEACRMGMEALKRTMWVPFSKRKPKKSGMFLIARHRPMFGNGYYEDLRYWDGKGFEGFDGYVSADYWMPQPELPDAAARTAR